MNGELSRTIKLYYDQDDVDQVQMQLSRFVEEPAKVLQDAIAYLSNWGTHYPVVDIYLRSSVDGEFMACYRARPYQDGDSPGYVIGAIFDKHAKKYGFNS